MTPRADAKLSEIVFAVAREHGSAGGVFLLLGREDVDTVTGVACATVHAPRLALALRSLADRIELEAGTT